MSKTETTVRDSVEPKIETQSSDDGVGYARQKALLSQAQAPLHVIDAIGSVPGREWLDDHEDARTYPTTQTFEDGTRIHLHQDVRESHDDAFGDFGSVDDDDEDVTWTVVDLTDGTVSLTVVGDWGKRRHVPFEEFSDDYEPLYLTNGEPQWGY